MSITTEIGKRIRYYRTGQGMSQERLAEYSDLHPTYIGQLERGEKTPTIETLYRITKGLHITLSTLVEGIEDFDKPFDNFVHKSLLLIEQQTPANQEHLFHVIEHILKMQR